jgi:hypothetical protein
MKFYLNKSIISEKEKLSWEKDDKLPRINLSQYDIIEGSMEDIENHIHDFVKKSFIDIKESMSINEFDEASIIMPSLQICSVDGINIIDVNIKIEDIESEDVNWLLKELSENLMGDLEDDEFLYQEGDIIEGVEEVEEVEESINPTEDEIAEMEMDIIRKSLLDDDDDM